MKFNNKYLFSIILFLCIYIPFSEAVQKGKKNKQRGVGDCCCFNSNCGNGFCDGGMGVLCACGGWIPRGRGKCTNLKPAGSYPLHGDYQSCVGRNGICGICGNKVGIGKKCSQNNDCDSNWCEGTITLGCNGRCKGQINNGQQARYRGTFTFTNPQWGNYDYNSCKVNQGVCGICGQAGQQENNQKCSNNQDCKSKYCNGDLTIMCGGKCVSKIADGQPSKSRTAEKIVDHPEWGLYDYNSCSSGNGVCGMCGKPGTGKKDGKCTVDTDCAMPMWCNGGGWGNTLGSCNGKCQPCPKACGDLGCHSRFNDLNNIGCGRMDEADHIKEDLESFGKGFLQLMNCLAPNGHKDGTSCVQDIHGSAESCMGGKDCIIKIGGEGSKCLQSEYFYFQNNNYEFKLADDEEGGSAKATVDVKVGLNFTANLGFGMNMKQKDYWIGLYNTGVGLNFTGQFKLTATKEIDSEYRKPFGNPYVLNSGAVMLGPVPFFWSITIQPVALIRVVGSISATITVDVQYLQMLKFNKAEFRMVNGKLQTPKIELDPNFIPTIRKTFEVSADLMATIYVHVGFEITAMVQGLPFKVFPNVAYVVNAKLSAKATSLGTEGNWMSEAYGGIDKKAYPIIGIKCRGEKCAEKKAKYKTCGPNQESLSVNELEYKKTHLKSQKGVVENNDVKMCASANMVGQGLICKGDHCEKFGLVCAPFSNEKVIIRQSDCKDTPWFGSEKSDFTECEEGRFVSAVNCQGSKCSKISLVCCRYEFTNGKELSTASIAAQGFTKVRHLPSSAQAWFKATDQLTGTEGYGDTANDDQEWSKKFSANDVKEFLFVSGDKKNWLIAEKDSVYGWYNGENRQVLKSSLNDKRHQVQMFRREQSKEDPWISLKDHFVSLKEGTLLYGENSFNSPEHVKSITEHSGADVYIKSSDKNGDVKLTAHPKGHVLIYKDKQWGTLCGHYWWDNENGAENICKQLGYSGGKKYTAGLGASGPINFGNRLCAGGEKTIMECPLMRGELEGCKHEFDQGVECSGERTFSDQTSSSGVNNNPTRKSMKNIKKFNYHRFSKKTHILDTIKNGEKGGIQLAGNIRGGWGVALGVYLNPFENLKTFVKDFVTAPGELLNQACIFVTSAIQQNKISCIAKALNVPDPVEWFKAQCATAAKKINLLVKDIEKLAEKGSMMPFIIEPQMCIIKGLSFVVGNLCENQTQCLGLNKVLGLIRRKNFRFSQKVIDRIQPLLKNQQAKGKMNLNKIRSNVKIERVQ